MKTWQRLLVIFMLASFPLAVYQFGLTKPGSGKKSFMDADRSSTSSSADAVLSELNRGIDTKAREIQNIDVKILESKGTVMRYEEQKASLVKDLEAFQRRLSMMLSDIKNGEAQDSSSLK